MLAALATPSDSAELPEDTENAEKAETTVSKKKDSLRVIIDRKGRKGKIATIIEGFTADDAEVAEIASELKRKIGTGGSSRGGEILLQGDWKDKVSVLLREMGYKTC